MKVNEIIDDCLRLVGRSDVAELTEPYEDEPKRMRYTLLFCFNAVMDELARGYFPIRFEEEMFSSTKRFAFTSFKKAPIKIVGVSSGGRSVKWRILPEYLSCDRTEITVEYEYVPAKCGEEDEFVYPDYAVSATLVEYGMAAEYLLICGDVQGSAAWESKYRGEIDRLLSLQTVRRRIPPRRWI